LTFGYLSERLESSNKERKTKMFEIIAKDDFGRVIEKMIAHTAEEAEAVHKLFVSVYGKRVSVIGLW